MDREVTLLGEMDKVKAEASKYCIIFSEYAGWTKAVLLTRHPGAVSILHI